jgi:hypothetical protein
MPQVQEDVLSLTINSIKLAINKNQNPGTHNIWPTVEKRSKIPKASWARWYALVILAVQEAEAGGSLESRSSRSS